ncbi:MAG: ECF-type sigma factor [Tahibacter sp.]
MTDAPLTDLVHAAARGESAAQDALFGRLYEDLRLCAHRQLRGSPAQTLSTTALVHETYVKLSAATLPVADRHHFMALAARAMRQVLVDHARRIHAEKRGGAAIMVTLDERMPDGAEDALEVLALDHALAELEQIDMRAARVVQLHFFGGLGFAEVAELEGVTVRTVLRDWQAARALLASRMQSADRN